MWNQDELSERYCNLYCTKSTKNSKNQGESQKLPRI